MNKNIDEKSLTKRLQAAVISVLDPDLAKLASDVFTVKQLELLLRVQSLRPTFMQHLFSESKLSLSDPHCTSGGPRSEKDPNVKD